MALTTMSDFVPTFFSVAQSWFFALAHSQSIYCLCVTRLCQLCANVFGTLAQSPYRVENQRFTDFVPTLCQRYFARGTKSVSCLFVRWCEFVPLAHPSQGTAPPYNYVIGGGEAQRLAQSHLTSKWGWGSTRLVGRSGRRFWLVADPPTPTTLNAPAGLRKGTAPGVGESNGKARRPLRQADADQDRMG